MGLFGFGKKKKRKQEEQRKKQEELSRQIKLEEEKLSKESAEAEKQSFIDEKKVEKKELVKETTPKKNSDKKAVVKETISKKPEGYEGPCGKFEIYPEAGLFKYRLKASNGEVLVVSFGYASRKGARNGINTFKKAVEVGNFEVFTDKAGFSHFDLFGSRGARVICIGEFYKTKSSAEAAVESVKKFSQCENYIDLEEIPATEVRETLIDDQDVEGKPNGKFRLSKQNSKSFFVKLLASNGQILLVTQRYASKQSALNGIESIKKAVANQNFTIYKDKQNRFQFNLYTANKQLIVSGETYPQKANCLSSVKSVMRFAEQAELVEV